MRVLRGGPVASRLSDHVCAWGTGGKAGARRFALRVGAIPTRRPRACGRNACKPAPGGGAAGVAGKLRGEEQQALRAWLQSVCPAPEAPGRAAAAEQVLQAVAERAAAEGDRARSGDASAAWAETHVVSDVQQYARACQSGADVAVADDPPPAGPSYRRVLLNPPKPSEAKALDVSASKFQIEYTYCISVRPRPGAEFGVALFDYVYSDRRSCTPDAGRPLQPVAARNWPVGEPGWRCSCRKTQPELEEFNLEALQRRLVKQRGAANGRTTRQDGVLEKLRRAELEHAKRKEKATRQKQRVASLLASSASSSSDSSSDSSIEQ